MEIDDEDLQTLIQAWAQAKRLLDELLKKQAELLASPPDLPADRLAAGKVAIQKAVEAAERTLRGLDEAMQAAGVQPH